MSEVNWKKGKGEFFIPKELSSILGDTLRLTETAVGLAKQGSGLLKKIKYFFAEDVNPYMIALVFIIEEAVKILERFRKTSMYFFVVRPGVAPKAPYEINSYDDLGTAYNNFTDNNNDNLDKKDLKRARKLYIEQYVDLKDFGYLTKVNEINALTMKIYKIDTVLNEFNAYIKSIERSKVLLAVEKKKQQLTEKEYKAAIEGLDKNSYAINTYDFKQPDKDVSDFVVDFKTTVVKNYNGKSLSQGRKEQQTIKRSYENKLALLKKQENQGFWRIGSRELCEYIHGQLDNQSTYNEKDVFGAVIFISAFGGKSILPLLNNITTIAKVLGKLLDIGPFTELANSYDKFTTNLETNGIQKGGTNTFDPLTIGETYYKNLPKVITDPIRGLEQYLNGMLESIAQGLEQVDSLIALIDKKIAEIEKLQKAFQNIYDLIESLKAGIDPVYAFDGWTSSYLYSIYTVVNVNDSLYIVSEVPEDESQGKSSSKIPDFNSIKYTSNVLTDNQLSWKYVGEYTNKNDGVITWSSDTNYTQGTKVQFEDYIIQVKRLKQENGISGASEPDWSELLPNSLQSEESINLFEKEVIDKDIIWKFHSFYEELPTPESQGGTFMLAVPPQLGGIKVIKDKLLDENDENNPRNKDYFYSIASGFMGGGIGIALLMALADPDSMSLNEALGYSDEDINKFDPVTTKILTELDNADGL